MFTLFFIELNNFKKNILSLTKYNNIESPNIVILTGGANRIKDGLKIIENFKNSKNINYKILVSAGVASAISSGFGAPLAGLIFAREVILRHQSLASFSPILLSSIISYVSLFFNYYK